MRTAQFNKTIRREIRLGWKYMMDDIVEIDNDRKPVYKRRPYICIGKYAHIATFKQTVPPYLTKSYTWFDLNELAVKKRMECVGYGLKRKVV